MLARTTKTFAEKPPTLSKKAKLSRYSELVNKRRKKVDPNKAAEEMTQEQKQALADSAYDSAVATLEEMEKRLRIKQEATEINDRIEGVMLDHASASKEDGLYWLASGDAGSRLDAFLETRQVIENMFVEFARMGMTRAEGLKRINAWFAKTKSEAAMMSASVVMEGDDDQGSMSAMESILSLVTGLEGAHGRLSKLFKTYCLQTQGTIIKMKLSAERGAEERVQALAEAESQVRKLQAELDTFQDHFRDLQQSVQSAVAEKLAVEQKAKEREKALQEELQRALQEAFLGKKLVENERASVKEQGEQFRKANSKLKQELAAVEDELQQLRQSSSEAAEEAAVTLEQLKQELKEKKKALVLLKSKMGGEGKEMARLEKELGSAKLQVPARGPFPCTGSEPPSFASPCLVVSLPLLRRSVAY